MISFVPEDKRITFEDKIFGSNSGFFLEALRGPKMQENIRGTKGFGAFGLPEKTQFWSSFLSHLGTTAVIYLSSGTKESPARTKNQPARGDLEGGIPYRDLNFG